MRIMLWSSLGLALFLAGCGSSSTTPTPKRLVPKFSYVTNYSARTGQPYTLSGFLVDPTSGQLTPIPGSPFTAGQGPNSITIDSGGPYLYAANAGSFSLFPNMFVQASLNVSGYEINDVSAFSITSNGSLSPVSGSPFGPTGYSPSSIIVLGALE